MYWLRCSLVQVAEHLALEEALWQWASQGALDQGVLWVWEPSQEAVVVGRSCQVQREVHLQSCQQQAVPVLRRCTGGGAVVLGPGCLVYCLVVPWGEGVGPRGVHAQVLAPLAEQLRKHFPQVRQAGISDLTYQDRKFSGNSVRLGRRWCWYHGTLLYRFPIHRVGELLPHPPREPHYRQGRNHEAFLTNLPASRPQLEQILRRAWGECQELRQWPVRLMTQLYLRRYANPQWHFQR